MRTGTPRFTLVRRLGSGGMADVFLARDTSRGGRLVALKRLRGGQEPDLVTHFHREARIGALLSHPNVVSVEDAGQDEEGLYLALEYVDGVSVSKLLRFFAQRRAALPVEQWSVLARDIAAGLHYAHCVPVKGAASGVLHRDLSPDNVLVSREGVARLSDFGLAYVQGDTRLTRTGTVKGKVTYLAPELFEGGAPSIASDIYALGVMLFRMASGMAPFRGNNEGELILNILRGERPLLSALRPDLPGPLCAWVQQAIGAPIPERPELPALLKLLPEVAASAAPRAALAEAVASASEQEASRTATPQEGSRLAPPVPREASTEPVQPARPVDAPSQENEAPTEPVRRIVPTPSQLHEVPTTPALRALPLRSADGDEPTEPVSRLLPGGDFTPLQRPGPLERSARSWKRPPAWALAAAAGLAGALALGAWAWLSS